MIFETYSVFPQLPFVQVIGAYDADGHRFCEMEAWFGQFRRSVHVHIADDGGLLSADLIQLQVLFALRALVHVHPEAHA